MSRCPTILLDLDGTVLDSGSAIIESLRYAMTSMGHGLPDNRNLKQLIGPPIRNVLEQLLQPFGDSRVDKAVDLYRTHFRDNGVYNCSPYVGMEDVLRQLQLDGYRLLVATSKRQVFADLMLENAGLIAFFSGIFGTPADGSLDSKDRLLAALLRNTGLEPGSAVMIGDRREDMVAAILSQITPIGALWGYGSRTELLDAGAAALCPNPAGLPKIIKNLLPSWSA